MAATHPLSPGGLARDPVEPGPGARDDAGGARSGRATLLTAAAAGAWQQGLREELRRAAAMIEDVRYVYGDEAPLALELAFAQAWEAELHGGDAETEREALFAMEQALPADHFTGEAYERRGEGYDVARRLADIRELRPALLRLDLETTVATGDRYRRAALVLLLATIPLVVLYLVADLVLRRRAGAPTRSRTATGSGTEPHDVGLVPRPWSAPGPRRLWASVGLAAWLAITLLPALQLHFTGREQRAQALAASKASQVSTMLEASGLLSSFASGAEHRVRWMEVHALARRVAAADSSNPDEAAELRASARAERAVSERARTIAAAMSRLPSASSGVDPATRSALGASPATADLLREEQNRDVDAVERAGTRANRVTLAIVLAALAASLCALAAAARTHRHTSLEMAAAGVMAMSLAALASVPFV